MRLLTNEKRQPLLQTKDGKVINLNTLRPENTGKCVLVKPSKSVHLSSHRNNRFLDKAGRLFKVSKLATMPCVTYYLLDANIKLFCIVKSDEVQLIGNYPIYYLKLLFRYIDNSL
jgi:hypothetical protein